MQFGGILEQENATTHIVDMFDRPQRHIEETSKCSVTGSRRTLDAFCSHLGRAKFTTTEGAWVARLYQIVHSPLVNEKKTASNGCRPNTTSYRQYLSFRFRYVKYVVWKGW